MAKYIIAFFMLFFAISASGQSKIDSLEMKLTGIWKYDSTCIEKLKLSEVADNKIDYARFVKDTLTITEFGQKSIGKWTILPDNFMLFETFDKKLKLTFLIYMPSENELILSDNKQNKIDKEVKAYFSRSMK